MANQFELKDIEDAQDYLSTFDGATRGRGETYFRQGRVVELRCVKPGIAYNAKVRGSFLYEVNLVYSEEEGWTGLCSCPMGFDCKHVVAALKTLLAEGNLAQVQALSAGTKSQWAQSFPNRVRPESLQPADRPFAEKVAQALQRPLRRDEADFLRKLGMVYNTCSRTRRITYMEFEALGLQMGQYGWESLAIWPAFPADQHAFWLYVANAAQERGAPIPPFLEPVTDLSAVQAELASWRRGLDIERWKQLLGNTAVSKGVCAKACKTECDLRIRLTHTDAVLEYKRPGSEAFEPINNRLLRQLIEEHQFGRLVMPGEAELIWQLFQQRFLYGGSVSLSFKDRQNLSVFGRLLRLQMLESRIVAFDGRPMARSAETLRWNLAPPANPNEDYSLRLVRMDGSPVPELLFAIEDAAPLYVTSDTVFKGPPLMTNIVDPIKETNIPAQALETLAGVQFLETMRIDLPPRIQERVRRVPVKVAIYCELNTSLAVNPVEYCLFQVRAEAPDGKWRETWTGNSWQNANPMAPFGDMPARDGAIILYDRSAMEDIPSLLKPLNLKFGYQYQRLSLRVTKKFPTVFTEWLRSVPPHIDVYLAGELASLAGKAVSGHVRLEATETDIDWFDLRVVLDVSDTELTPEEIKLLLNAKGGYVRLGKKGWRRLAFNLSEEDDERLARLGLNPNELTAEPQRMHALQLADESAKRFLPAVQVEQIQRRASEIKTRVTPPLPPGITAELRPYQLEGFHFLAYLEANRFGGILADDMGLGKTLQTLAWLVWLRTQPERATRPSLVVCPKSVMDNWRAEAGRFTASVRVKVWSASELDAFVDRLSEADLHVINYSQLRLLGEGLITVRWLALILDEGQYIKNPNSQTAQVARSLHAEHRLVLTGTPIENRLMDLWSLMAFVMPGVLGSRQHFLRVYDSKSDPFARRRLSARVRPFLIRRTKSQVAKDLPDRIEEDLYCEIEGEQKALYSAELKLAQQMLLKIQTQKELAKSQFNILASLLRLRQICCHPALVKPGSKAESAKVNALIEQLEPLMEEGEKVLVFSQFVQMLELLKPELEARGWPFYYLAGETENRGELVEKFQTAKGAAVFLISLRAGGFGLNLTAASYVVLFDPWWNPAVENQAIDRTHRIGQSRNVMAYRLLIKGSVEEKIRALQKKKSALAEDVLGEEKFSQSLTLDDLQFLFAD